MNQRNSQCVIFYFSVAFFNNQIKIDNFSGRNIIIGLLKIGYKNLYLTDEKNQTYQTTPLCILDFYIHDSLQRRGYGHTLFDYMLQVRPFFTSK